MFRHLRQVTVVLIGGIAMYSVKLPYSLLPVELLRALGSSGLYKFQIAESLIVSTLVGYGMTRLLTWKWRVPAILAMPAFILVWFPYQTSRQAREHFGPEYTFTRYFWNHFPYFSPYLIGAVLGVAAAVSVSKRKSLNAA